MNLPTFDKKLRKLNKDVNQLYKRVEAGKATDAEIKHRANELGNEYVKLSRKAETLPYFYVGKYIESSCLKVGIDLKLLAASKSPRKGPFTVHNKMITSKPQKGAK